MRLLIDTDLGMGTPGSDPEDGMAILYALNTDGVTVEGVSVVAGNVPRAEAWANARHLLDLAGHGDVPLHAGAAGPSDPGRRPLQAAWASRTGNSSAGDAPSDTAARFLCDTVLAAPGEITVVAIGPLTNVAAAIEADAGFAPALGGLVIMGGTVRVPGNITPAAEFNLWMDPEAADIVMGSRAPITMVGLDVCHQTRFERAQADDLRDGGSPLADLVGGSAQSWMDVAGTLLDDEEGLYLYDTVAVASAIEPDLLGVQPALVEIETSTGPAQGMSVCHLDDVMRKLITSREPNASVATAIDVPRFQARFTDRVIDRIER
jgi:inosine-uridine nucleoside N-ribohydrolase